jgi:hypothetical protein
MGQEQNIRSFGNIESRHTRLGNEKDNFERSCS